MNCTKVCSINDELAAGGCLNLGFSRGNSYNTQSKPLLSSYGLVEPVQTSSGKIR